MANSEKIPPGFKLLHTLRGHQGQIYGIAWSPDGETLASASGDWTISLWDTGKGESCRTLIGHSNEVNCVAWSPDGDSLASGSDDGSIRIWNPKSGELRCSLPGHSHAVTTISWSPSGRSLVSGSAFGTIKLWTIESGKLRITLSGHQQHVVSLAWSPDGRTLASGSQDCSVKVWDAESGKLRRTLRHSASVLCVEWSPDGEILASGSVESTVRLWQAETGFQLRVLEGHTRAVSALSFSGDRRLLASASEDGSVRLWDCDSWETVAVLSETSGSRACVRFAFRSKGTALATLGDGDASVRIWDLDVGILLKAKPEIASIQYCNAKVVLLGETGVGKSGLALVLTGQAFAATESTHGRHVWTFSEDDVQLDQKRKEAREILLWDLAGQPGYRLIHQLHLDEVAVALVVFDSRSETDPFASVRHWDRALRQAQRLHGEGAPPLKKFLVAARVDRGGIGVSPVRIDTLVRELGFNGYFETSAKDGMNVAKLASTMRQAIAWDSLPKVSSNELFQCIKSFLVAEKEAGRLLAHQDDLYRALLESRGLPPNVNRGEDLRAQFETCIGRVESAGLIRRLSFGNIVLLQPELLDAYASAMVNAAKSEPDGLGSIAEEDVRMGRFHIPPDERLKDRGQEKVVLIATVEDLLRHQIALREQADEGAYLVFPSQMTREYPDFPDPEGKAVIFEFEGAVLNVYTTLAVRLSHSGTFKKQDMWKNAASYTAMVGGTCGMRLREVDEGRGELTLFFDSSATEQTRYQFEEYVRVHLERRAMVETCRRRRIFMCRECCTPVTSLQATKRRERGFNWIDCNVCGERVPLLDREERLAVSSPSVVSEMDRAADARRDFDASMVSATGTTATPSFKKWAGSSRTTLAVVFTDVVGSTALGNEIGDEQMYDIRNAHFQQARRLVNTFEGYEVETIGDSFLVAFHTAVQALNFALGFSASTGNERIKIRAGIHVGPVRIDGEGAFGAVLNYAARVVSSAKLAEIWLSDRAKEDIDQEMAKAHEGLKWNKHPECELKGFPEKQALWSVY